MLDLCNASRAILSILNIVIAEQTKEAAYLNGRSNRVAYHSVCKTLTFFFLRAARH
jgi:hypothetical protein